MAIPFARSSKMRENANRVAAALEYLPLNDEHNFIVHQTDDQSMHSNSIDLKDPFDEEDDPGSTAATTPTASSSRKQSNKSVSSFHSVDYL